MHMYKKDMDICTFAFRVIEVNVSLAFLVIINRDSYLVKQNHFIVQQQQKIWVSILVATQASHFKIFLIV